MKKVFYIMSVLSLSFSAIAANQGKMIQVQGKDGVQLELELVYDNAQVNPEGKLVIEGPMVALKKKMAADRKVMLDYNDVTATALCQQLGYSKGTAKETSETTPFLGNYELISANNADKKLTLYVQADSDSIRKGTIVCQ
ncbi:MAG TPA: hypothetical protein VIG33_06555 [Pseudobdellovibrionaceae bacterium]|jgi:hypothetical protein